MKRDFTIFLGTVILIIIILLSRCSGGMMKKTEPSPTIAITPTPSITQNPLPTYKNVITPVPTKQVVAPKKEYKPNSKNEIFIDVN